MIDLIRIATRAYVYIALARVGFVLGHGYFWLLVRRRP